MSYMSYMSYMSSFLTDKSLTSHTSLTFRVIFQTSDTPRGSVRSDVREIFEMLNIPYILK